MAFSSQLSAFNFGTSSTTHRGTRGTVFAAILLAASTLHAQNTPLDIAVSISEPPGAVRVGEIASMRLDVRNLSQSAAPVVSISGGVGPMDVSETPVLLLSAKGERSVCRVERDSFTCTSLNFGSGFRDSIVINFAPRVAGPRSVVVSLVEPAIDSNAANNRASISFEVTAAAASADLELTLTAPERATAGSSVRQSFVIENRGPSNATGAVLSIFSEYAGFARQLPAGCVASGPTISCLLSSIAAGSSTTFTLDYIAVSGNFPFETIATATPLGAGDVTLARARSTTQVVSPGEAGFEKILIPLTPNKVNAAPSGNGPRWQVTLSVLNQSTSPVQILGYDQNCRLSACPPAVPTGSRITFTPQLNDFQNEVQGMFLFVERSRSSDVEMQLRVRDLTRQAQSWGASIPVIAEGDAFRGMRNILEVPADSLHRVRLRVYDFDAKLEAAFNVRLYALHDDLRLIGDGRSPDPQVGSTLLQTRVATTGGGTTFHPGYAEIDVSSIAQRRGSTRLRIEIEPVQQDLRWWGFATATNNETQQVTVLLPR